MKQKALILTPHIAKPIGVYPLNYPYYLTDGSTKSFSTETFYILPERPGVLVTNPLLVFRLRLEALYAALGLTETIHDLVFQFRVAQLRVKFLVDQRLGVANMVKQIWPMLSLFRADQASARGKITRIECLIGQNAVEVLPVTRTPGGPSVSGPFAPWLSNPPFPQPVPGNITIHTMIRLQSGASTPNVATVPVVVPTSSIDQNAATTRFQSMINKPRFADIEGLPKAITHTAPAPFPDDLSLQDANLDFDGDCESGYAGAKDPSNGPNDWKWPADISPWVNEEANIQPEIFTDTTTNGPTDPALLALLVGGAEPSPQPDPNSLIPAPSSTVQGSVDSTGHQVPNQPAAPRATPVSENIQVVARPFSLKGQASGRDVGTPALRNTVQLLSPGCFILGADFTTGSADGVTEVPTSDTLIGLFIANFPSGAVALEQTFPSDGTVATRNLHSLDPWLRSAISNNIGTTAMSFTGSLHNHKVALTNFNATLVVGGKSLQFSTADTARVLSISEVVVPAPSGGTATTTSNLATSLVPDYQILVLGLSKSTPPVTFDLSEILHLIAGTSSTTQLPGFLDDFSLTLDDSDDSGSAVYYQPDANYTTDLRLKFIAGNSESKIKELFGWLAEKIDFISLSQTSATIHKTALIQDIPPNYTLSTACHVTFSTEVTITIDPSTSLDFTFWIVFGQDTTRLVIRFNPGEDPATLLGKALDWATKRFDGFVGLDLQPSTLLPPGEVPIQLRQMDIEMSNPNNQATPPTKFTMNTASLDFEITIHSAVFRVTTSWPDLSLSANLWLANADLAFGSLRMLPSREDFDDLAPASGVLPSFIKITDLVPAAAALPSGIPDLITELQFRAWKDSIDSGFQFTGKIQCEAPSSVPTKMPIFRIGELDVLAAYDFSTSQYDVQLSTKLFLFPRVFPDLVDGLTPASLDLMVENNSGVWTLSASLLNLKLALLYSLFDSDSSPSVMNIMKHFDIILLDATYQYQGSLASNFRMVGILGIGPFELDLDYVYDSNGWTFAAYLGSQDSTGTTLGALIETIAGPGSNIVSLLNDVPFVSNISIPAAPGAGINNSSNAPVQLEVVKTESHIVFWIELNIVTNDGTISLTFIQLQESTPVTPSGSTPPDPNAAPTLATPKRILRVNVNNIPSLPSVPVVGTLPVPFDNLEYLWVQDANATTPGAPAGFTRAEIDLINGALGGQPILFRDTTPNPPSAATAADVASTSNTPVLLIGHHFVVSSDGKVIVDHLFGGNTVTPAPSGQAGQKTVLHNVVRSVAAPADTNVADADSGTTLGSTKKSIGPLSIQNLGLQLKDSCLYIHVDATVALGTIIMTFVGFAVGLPLSDFNLSEMSKIRITDFRVKLDGLSVYMNSPPLLVAGTFIDGSTSVSEFYKGGIAMSILPYTLLAVGAYERVYATATTREYKSVFIFARLDGPLFTLEFAEIGGVKAGFGYNSLMKLPDAAQIMSYPLIEASGTKADNPMDVLNSFGSWVSTADGPLWFAVGMKVTAFQILNIDAALLLSFTPSPTIAVIADAIASMPPDAPRDACFLYVELGIIGAIDIAGGSFRVEAQLSPNSFVLYPACHLTGGFAMCYWFAGSPFEGELSGKENSSH